MLLVDCVLTTPFEVISRVNELAPAAYKVLNGLPLMGYPEIARRVLMIYQAGKAQRIGQLQQVVE